MRFDLSSPLSVETKVDGKHPLWDWSFLPSGITQRIACLTMSYLDTNENKDISIFDYCLQENRVHWRRIEVAAAIDQDLEDLVKKSR